MENEDIIQETIIQIASKINEDKGRFLATELLKIYVETKDVEIKLRILEDLCKYDTLYEP